MSKVSDEVRAYMAEIGKRGGEAGKGDAKRRARMHYVRAVNKRWQAERERREAANPKPEPEVKKVRTWRDFPGGGGEGA